MSERAGEQLQFTCLSTGNRDVWYATDNIPMEIAFIFEESGTVHTQCTPEQVSRRSIDGLFEVEHWRRDKERRAR